MDLSRVILASPSSSTKVMVNRVPMTNLILPMTPHNWLWFCCRKRLSLQKVDTITFNLIKSK